jgi:hypothetical protein
MRGSRSVIRLVGLLAVATIACSHPLPEPTSLASEVDRYCWWTVLRTALPSDTVAQRFAHAYRVLGLGDSRLTLRGDTAWVRAGPTVLDDGSVAATYASSAIAVRQGDSTSFRYFVEITRPSSATGASPDRIEFCGRVAKAAGIPWSKPQRRPNGEDSLPVFMRSP